MFARYAWKLSGFEGCLLPLLRWFAWLFVTKYLLVAANPAIWIFSTRVPRVCAAVYQMRWEPQVIDAIWNPTIVTVRYCQGRGALMPCRDDLRHDDQLKREGETFRTNRAKHTCSWISVPPFASLGEVRSQRRGQPRPKLTIGRPSDNIFIGEKK